MKKRFAALILALIMAVSVLPVTAMAADYNIVVATDGNGKAKCVKGTSSLEEVKTAADGSDVYLRVFPDRGYKLESITVNDGKQDLRDTDVDGTPKREYRRTNEFTFKMPLADITITVTFQKIPTLNFTDLTEKKFARMAELFDDETEDVIAAVSNWLGAERFANDEEEEWSGIGAWINEYTNICNAITEAEKIIEAGATGVQLSDAEATLANAQQRLYDYAYIVYLLLDECFATNQIDRDAFFSTTGGTPMTIEAAMKQLFLNARNSTRAQCTETLLDAIKDKWIENFETVYDRLYSELTADAAKSHSFLRKEFMYQVYRDRLMNDLPEDISAHIEKAMENGLEAWLKDANEDKMFGFIETLKLAKEELSKLNEKETKEAQALTAELLAEFYYSTVANFESYLFNVAPHSKEGMKSYSAYFKAFNNIYYMPINYVKSVAESIDEWNIKTCGEAIEVMIKTYEGMQNGYNELYASCKEETEEAVAYYSNLRGDLEKSYKAAALTRTAETVVGVLAVGAVTRLVSRSVVTVARAAVGGMVALRAIRTVTSFMFRTVRWF